MRNTFPINMYWFADGVWEDGAYPFYYDTVLKRRPTTTMRQELEVVCPGQDYPFYIFRGIRKKVLGAFDLRAYTETYFHDVLVPWLDMNYRWMSAQDPRWGQEMLATNNPVYMCLPVVFQTAEPWYYTVTGEVNGKVLHPFISYSIMAFIDPVEYQKRSIYVHPNSVRDMITLRSKYLQATA